MIKTGIVGCGFGARYHGKVIVNNFSDKYKLVAFCDVNKDKLENACKEFNVKGYNDFEKFLEDKEIELIVIATVLYLFGLPEKIIGKLLYPFNEWDKHGYFSSLFISSDFVAEVSAFPQAKPFTLPRFYIAGEKGSLVHGWVQRREDSILRHMYFVQKKDLNLISFLRNIIQIINSISPLFMKMFMTQ